MMYGLYAEGKLIIHGVLYICTACTEGKLIIHGVLIYDVLVQRVN